MTRDDNSQSSGTQALRLIQKVREQSALAEFSLQAFGSENFSRLVDRAAEIAQEVLDADFTIITRYDTGRNQVQEISAAGKELDQNPKSIGEFAATSWPRILTKTRRCLRFNDAAHDERFDLIPALAELGVKSGIGTVVSGVEHVSIVVAAYCVSERMFTDDDAEFLQMLANLVGLIKQRRFALQRLRLRDRALDAISQGITITDEARAQPCIIYANPAFANMTGYAQHELFGRLTRSFLAEDPTVTGTVDKLALARAKKRPVRIEARAFRKDGTSFIDRVAASPITDEDGNLIHYVAVHDDITAERRREERLNEAQRMEAVGKLTGGIAHDFNNLLTVIRANAEDFVADMPPGSIHKKQADMILRAANRGAELIQQLMAFARKQELEPMALDVNELLQKFARLFQRALPESIKFDVKAGSENMWVRVDPSRLEGALLNLCLNARDAMPTGGALSIETSVRELDEEYVAEHFGVDAGLYVELAVSDNGSGIPKDVAERAFEPFFTTKEVGKGTGLGLSMVYGFVKQSGGHARIYSEPDNGTTVKLYLPLVTERGKESNPLVADTNPVLRHGDKVLLVEDDDLVRESVQAKLLRLGFRVHSVGSAALAVEVLEKGALFDLVFTDVVMPGGMSGADLVRMVRARWPNVRVLMTSGYTEASGLGKVSMPEGVRLLSKPYSNAELDRALTEVLT